jgi:prepilin signal peptidase PulO-like enzyme (type II secretory pathway)
MITDNIKVFSFKPNQYSIRLSVVVLTVLIILALVFAYFYNETNQGLRVVFFILVPYLMVHSLYDIFIRSEICYTFDKDSGLLIEKFPFSRQKS